MESPAGFLSYANIVQGHFSEPVSNGENNNINEGNAGPQPKVGSNGRFFDVTEHWVSQDEPGECFPTAQSSKPALITSRRFGEHSLLLRRILIPQSPPRIQLEIQSPDLQHVFRKITRGLQTINVHADPIVISAPYHELYHFLTELDAERLAPPTSDKLKRELQLFRDFERDHLSRVVDLAAIRDHKREGTIRFEYLWALFKPHELVLMQSQGTDNTRMLFCGVLQKYWVDVASGRWYIRVRYLSFHNGRFGAVEKSFPFTIFPGVLKIDSLPAFPLAYCDGQVGIKADLEKRGRRFIELCKESTGEEGGAANRRGGWLGEYKGPVWVQRERYEPDGTGFFDAPEQAIEGRVVIDPAGFASENPLFRERIMPGPLFPGAYDPAASDSAETLPAEGSFTDPPPIDTEKLTQDELICFPAMIAGYSLTTKHSGFFHVGSVKNVSWEHDEAKQMFESSSKMKAVHNIVSGFSYESRSFGYSIGGKGKGLVFLFFGPSGTGKTLTAECVAEKLERPLYRVSGSDLGSSPREIEDNLQDAFNRIARWQAILLLDEADAFMAERADDSLDRNTLVSILLRLLEYQSGIVILTTNRQDHFDKAFHSRIHVTISFPSLRQKEREAIWRSQVRTPITQPLGSVSRSVVTTAGLSDEDFAALSELELDGRSIKNVFHVAGLYARTRGGPGSSHEAISLADLKAVLQIALGDVSKELKKQLEEFCK